MATKRWLGSAAAVNDLWTTTLSGTVVSQTYTMTVNGKNVTYTAGGADSVSTILQALQTAWGVTTIAEFNELLAVALPNGGPYTSVTLMGITPGKPSTVSVSTSGSATFAVTHTTSATGPNDFTNTQNWSTGSAPANSDTLVFDNGGVPCLYNLGSSLTGVTVRVEPGYTGRIGLPFINADSNRTYTEYRTTALTLAGGTAVVNAPSLQRCNLAFGANDFTCRVLSTGQRIEQYTPVVLLTGGSTATELDISLGDVGVAFLVSTTATIPKISSSYVNNAVSDVKLTAGTGATLTTISKNGGSAIINASATTITQGIAGGTVTIGESAAVATLNVQGGTAVYNSVGALGTVNVSNKAVLDFSQDPRAKTVTNPINLFGDASIVKDDSKLVNSGVLSVTAHQTTKLNVSHGSDNVCSFT